jgi:hypothetical protein
MTALTSPPSTGSPADASAPTMCRVRCADPTSHTWASAVRFCAYGTSSLVSRGSVAPGAAQAVTPAIAVPGNRTRTDEHRRNGRGLQPRAEIAPGERQNLDDFAVSRHRRQFGVGQRHVIITELTERIQFPRRDVVFVVLIEAVQKHHSIAPSIRHDNSIPAPLASSCRRICTRTPPAETIKDVRELLNIDPPAADASTSSTDGRDRSGTALAHPCPCSGGRMFVIETFDPGCQPRHRPTVSSQSGSTPHDREHNLPHHRARFALVFDRQRCRTARELPSTACDAPDITKHRVRDTLSNPIIRASAITGSPRIDGDCLPAVP